MNFFFKFFQTVLIFFFLFQPTNAAQILKYADVDKIIKETKIGNRMINKINEIDKKNIEKLNSFEKELKSIENEIKLKKNIISEQQFEKEINDLKIKIAEFNKEKNSMVKDLSDIKNKELKIFFDTINPIVQNYMNEKSIDILFNSNNIYIGNKKSDLTKQLIEEINSKLSNN